ncbi:MAG: O-antigen ligase family protein [Rhodospirillales bacterium]|nr:O-antigen ligase family protein [Rhodospirillales bacterium]
MIAAPTTGYPKINDNLAIAYVAISTLIMAYSYLLSIVPILLFYAIWLPHMLFKKQFILKPSGDLILPALISIYCVFSTFWSGYPRTTLVDSLEYVSMIVCTMIIARTVSLEAFLKGLSIGIFLVLIVLFRTGTFSFEGLFGSKNQVGLYAEIGIFIALLLLFKFRKKPGELLVFALVPLALAVICLILSHSASSLLSLAVVLSLSVAACFLSAFPRSLRPFLLGLMVFAIATAAMMLFAFDINPQAEILKAVGKSPTLTGRTWLWGQGLEIAMNKPWLGYGYSGFWVPGQSEAERLGRVFFVPVPSSFHFHSVFVQVLVDLGVIGVLLISFVILGSCLVGLFRVLREGCNTETIFLLGMAFMFLVRGFVEIDFFGPFGIGVLLFYFVWARLLLGRREHKAQIAKETAENRAAES